MEPRINISATLSQAQKQDIQNDIDTIKGVLSFLVNLTPDQRKSLRKMGTKRTGYVADVFDAVKTNPDVLAAAFDFAEYEKDKILFDDLSEVSGWLAALAEGVDDTLMALGNELMKQSDSGYDYLKRAAKDNEALSTVVDKIGEAFAGQGRTGADDSEATEGGSDATPAA